MTEKLPAGWRKCELGTLVDFNPKNLLQDDSLALFAPMKTIPTRYLDKIEFETRSWSEIKKGFTHFNRNDVVLAKITPCFENGKSAIIEHDSIPCGAGTTEIFVLRPKPEVLVSKYLLAFLKTPAFIEGCTQNMRGAVGQKRVPKDYLLAYEMPVPSFLEQKHIVAKLDRLLAKVDSCRAHLDRAATAIKRFRQSVLNAAVTGRLTEELAITNQADIDQIQELIFERKTKQKESSEKLEIELDYMLPENWLTAPLSLLMDSCSYGSSKKSEKRGLVPVLRMGNIQSGALDWSDLVYSSDPVEIEKYGLKSGDVLFNRTNSPELVGKSAIYGGGQPKAIFAGYLIRVRASSLLNPQFLTYCLNSSYGRHFSWQVKTDGVSQSNINATKLSALPVPLCSAKEQEAIVERAENLFAKANEMSVKLIAARARVDNLTASILAKAFRGELVGNED